MPSSRRDTLQIDPTEKHWSTWLPAKVLGMHCKVLSDALLHLEIPQKFLDPWGFVDGSWKRPPHTDFFFLFFPDVNQFVPNTHLMVCQWSWRSEKRLPVMIAGSIQLPGLSQFRLSVVAVLDVGTLWLALEGEEALGSPPKLMLMFGRSALSPSCHSFIFKLSTELLLSGRFTNKKNER